MVLSVALCTYNGENYIAEQLDSILSQTLPVSQIVICDDVSTDKTLKILTDYQRKYPDIINVYENPENIGYVKNFEKALSLCTGDLIFLCDQDDKWLSNKTAIVTEIFEQNLNINLVCHNIKLFGEPIDTNNTTTYWHLENFNPQDFTNPTNLTKRLLYKGNVFPGMSMIFRNNFLNQNLPLKKINKTIIHDYELLLIAANQDSVWLEEQILGEYRIHSNQSIGFKKFSKAKEEEQKEITREQLFGIFKHYSFVKNVISGLNLSLNLQVSYKEYCISKYKEYLSKFSYPERIIKKLKIKYYFHIFDYLN